MKAIKKIWNDTEQVPEIAFSEIAVGAIKDIERALGHKLPDAPQTVDLAA